MRSEDLIALAAAQGVDLIAAAREGQAPPKRDVITKFKNGRRVSVLVEAPKHGAKGKQSETFVKPAWTLSELGQASNGVPEIYFDAACYAFAGDNSSGVYWRLMNALYDRARHLAKRWNWPLDVPNVHRIRSPYLQNLAALTLAEDKSPHLFKVAEGRLYSIFLHVDQKTWEKDLQERYWLLKTVWEGWYQSAARIIQPRLSNQEGEAEESLEEISA